MVQSSATRAGSESEHKHQELVVKINKINISHAKNGVVISTNVNFPI